MEDRSASTLYRENRFLYNLSVDLQSQHFYRQFMMAESFISKVLWSLIAVLFASSSSHSVLFLVNFSYVILCHYTVYSRQNHTDIHTLREGQGKIHQVIADKGKQELLY